MNISVNSEIKLFTGPSEESGKERFYWLEDTVHIMPKIRKDRASGSRILEGDFNEQIYSDNEDDSQNDSLNNENSTESDGNLEIKLKTLNHNTLLKNISNSYQKSLFKIINITFKPIWFSNNKSNISNLRTETGHPRGTTQQNPLGKKLQHQHFTLPTEKKRHRLQQTSQSRVNTTRRRKDPSLGRRVPLRLPVDECQPHRGLLRPSQFQKLL